MAEMVDNDDRHAEITGQMPQETGVSVQPSRGPADADDGEVVRGRATSSRRVRLGDRQIPGPLRDQGARARAQIAPSEIGLRRP